MHVADAELGFEENVVLEAVQVRPVQPFVVDVVEGRVVESAVQTGQVIGVEQLVDLELGPGGLDHEMEG